mmetsp:Transcript_19261/g.54399  ORF Transcript_19261/g.54399 Transcript_19261/m.54399 type:complete len:215 (-) Transcript_19261:119-763(-)
MARRPALPAGAGRRAPGGRGRPRALPGRRPRVGRPVHRAARALADGLVVPGARLAGGLHPGGPGPPAVRQWDVRASHRQGHEAGPAAPGRRRGVPGHRRQRVHGGQRPVRRLRVPVLLLAERRPAGGRPGRRARGQAQRAADHVRAPGGGDGVDRSGARGTSRGRRRRCCGCCRCWVGAMIPEEHAALTWRMEVRPVRGTRSSGLLSRAWRHEL